MLRATWRSLMAHKARLLMSGLSVVLGVAFVVGTFIFTDTLRGAFDQLFDGAVPDVVVTQRLEVPEFQEDGSVISVVPQSLLDEIRALPDVSMATGMVQVQGVTVIDAAGKPVGSNGPPNFGLSWPEFAGDPELSDVSLVEGRAPLDDDEVALDTQTAERGGFAIGDQVAIVTQGPRIEAELVGLVRLGVSGSTAGATLTFFERGYAQRTFVGADNWTQLSAQAVEGVTPEQLRDEVSQLAGSGFDVATGQEVQDDLKKQLSTALGFVNTFLLVFALIALFVGTFIILNTFSMLVARRTRELALLRAIGASRRQIMGSVIGEALVLGLVGGVAGIGLGIAVAAGLQELLALIGAELPAGSLVLAPRTIVIGLSVGTVVTVVAAFFPARRASQVPPVAAMRDDVALPARSLRVRGTAGTLMVLLGGALLAATLANEEMGSRMPLAGLASLALLVGVIVLAPVISRSIVGVLGLPIARSGTVGRLAVRNAQRDRRRTASTASAILIGLALVTGIGVLGASATKSTDALVDEVITADFVVQSTTFLPFSPEVSQRISEVPGVDVVSRVRLIPASIDGEPTTVTGVEPATIERAVDVGLAPGALDAGGITLDQEAFAAAGLSPGDMVNVTWANGATQQLVLRSAYEGQQTLTGWVTSVETMQAAGLPAVDFFVYVVLEPDADLAAVRTAFDAIQADFPTVQILDQTEFKESITGQITQLLNVVYALLGLSVIIAIFGVINTLALSIIERTREIGMLRAVGTQRRQVRQMIRWESVVICFFGAAVGLALGLGLGSSLQRLLASEGITELGIPWTLIGIVLVATALVAVLAAVWPARRAANLDILDAIRTE